jgi:hypothetical protein
MRRARLGLAAAVAAITPAMVPARPASRGSGDHPLAAARADSVPVLGGYRLADQFGRPHARADVAGRPALYVVAERGGSVALARWTVALRAAAGGAAREAGAPDSARAVLPDVAVVPAVTVSGVPRPFRGAVRRLLPRDRNAWTLIDWDGTLGAVRVAGAACAVSVVAPDGRVVRRTSVALPTASEVAGLVAAARATARPAVPPTPAGARADPPGR